MVPPDTGTPGKGREIYGEDADGQTGACKSMSLAIDLYSSKAIAVE